MSKILDGCAAPRVFHGRYTNAERSLVTCVIEHEHYFEVLFWDRTSRSVERGAFLDMLRQDAENQP